MSENRIARKNLVLALGIICIILLAGITFLTVLFISRVNNDTSLLNDRDSQIATLHAQVYNLTSILDLEQSANWVTNESIVQSANTYQSWSFSGNYTGYVSVVLQTNIEYGFYIRATYSNYLDNETANANYAIFPMLPSTSIQIFVGNTSPDGMNGTVTITYYY